MSVKNLYMERLQPFSFAIPSLVNNQNIHKIKQRVFELFGDDMPVIEENIMRVNISNKENFLETFTTLVNEFNLAQPAFHVSMAVESNQGTIAETVIFDNKQRISFLHHGHTRHPHVKICRSYLQDAANLLDEIEIQKKIFKIIELINSEYILVKNTCEDDRFSIRPIICEVETSTITHQATFRIPSSWPREAYDWLVTMLELLYQKNPPTENTPIAVDALKIRKADDFRIDDMPENIIAEYPFITLLPNADHCLFEEALSSTMKHFNLNGPDAAFSYIFFGDEEDELTHGTQRVFELRNNRLYCTTYDLPVLDVTLPHVATDLVMAWELIGSALLVSKNRLSNKITEKITAITNEMSEIMTPSLKTLREIDGIHSISQ